jgi:hypothetical protein
MTKLTCASASARAVAESGKNAKQAAADAADEVARATVGESVVPDTSELLRQVAQPNPAPGAGPVEVRMLGVGGVGGPGIARRWWCSFVQPACSFVQTARPRVDCAERVCERDGRRCAGRQIVVCLPQAAAKEEARFEKEENPLRQAAREAGKPAAQ